MDIDVQFNRISRDYDSKRKKFIPCYDDFYGATTAFIASTIKCPVSIMDLGAGTGLLTSFWHKHFPNAAYMLVDMADGMLDVARERFCGMENIRFRSLNYMDELPEFDFNVAISALSIHHLSGDDKAELFGRLHSRLPAGGLFVNYDQFCADDAIVNSWYDKYWIDHLHSCGLTGKDLSLWEERRKLDKEVSVASEIGMLEACGFSHVECVFSAQKFSVILTVK